jgi:ectoine hydroxylase-related dioxygenase (phytanoyl-CoA dioxygenase family)
MITQEQKNFFDKNGYLLVPNILNPQQVKDLREYLRPKFELPAEKKCKGDSNQFLFDIFSRNPALRWLLFHEPTVLVLRSLLGDDFVVLREAAAHFEMFGGWHKDTTSQERAGQKFQWDDDFLMVEVSYYLQDNSEEFGGGLDVQAGSHLKPDYFANPNKKNAVSKVRERIFGAREEESISIPSKAGDLVIFHFRANHKATSRTNNNPPPARQKMAIFTACSTNTPHVQRYHDFIASRPSYVYLQNGFSYPEDFAREAKA